MSLSVDVPSVYPTQAPVESSTTESAPSSDAPAPSSDAPAPSSDSPAPSPSPSPAPSTGGGSSNNGANAGSMTPNSKKAGVSAGNNLAALGDKIGWWYSTSIPAFSLCKTRKADIDPQTGRLPKTTPTRTLPTLSPCSGAAARRTVPTPRVSLPLKASRARPSGLLVWRSPTARPTA